jgi:hypothetical protein
MEFVSIFRALARRRLLVGVGALLSILVGVLLAGTLGSGPGSSPAKASALAAARVQLDFSTAIVADVFSVDETIPIQAALIADLVSGEQQRVEIARRAALRPSEVGIVRLQLAQLLAVAQLPDRAARTSALPVGKRYTVDVQAVQNLPILSITTAAPTVGVAKRLNKATIEQLRALVAARAPTPDRALRVIALDPVTGIIVRPPHRWSLYGFIGGIGFFVFWCCAVVVLSGLLALRPGMSALATPAA